MLSLTRWRPRHLLASWAAWWAALATTTLGPAAVAIARLASAPANTSSVSAGLDNGVMHLDVVNRGAMVWQGTATVTVAALWTAGPPLLIWLAWIATRPRLSVTSPGHLEHESAAMLDAGRGDMAAGDRPAPAMQERRDRE